MFHHSRTWRQLSAIFTSLTLILYPVAPVFADEIEVVVEEPAAVEAADVPIVTSEPVVEETVVTLEDSPVIEESEPVAEVSIAPEETPTEVLVPVVVEETENPTWNILPNGAAQTREPVSVHETYVAPQNSEVKVKFTTLPDEPGILTIKKVHLTEDQQTEVGALSSVAYDVTSTMANGTFRYNLTLPKVDSAENVQVLYAENVSDLSGAKEVTQVTQEEEHTVTIENLDHFTVFVLVNDIDQDNPDSLGDSDDIANGVLSGIADTYIEENNPTNDNHWNNTAFQVRSKNGGEDKRSLIKFDVTPASGGSPAVTKATLRLFMNDAPQDGPRTIELKRLLTPWTENTTNWNNQPGSSVTIDTESTGLTNSQWIEFDVTAEVQAVIDGSITNYGWLLKDLNEDQVPPHGNGYQTEFISSNSGQVEHRPQLIVDFATAANQPTEYNSPSAAAATVGGDNDGYETNTSGAFADGGLVASDNNTGSSVTGDRHLFYNYGFTVPVDATINGIEVRTDWYLDNVAGVNSLGVELSWDGGTSWTAAKADITETDKEHVASLGGAGNTWGHSWQPSELSDTNFRVRATNNSTVDTRDFFLDWIPVRVYFTPAAGDTTPPETTIDSGPSGTIGVDSATFEFSSNEGGSTFECQLDGLGFTSCTSPKSYTDLLDGTYTFDVRATDTEANTDLTAASQTFTVDTTAPAIPTPLTPADGAAIQGIAFDQTWTSEVDAVLYEYESCAVDPGDVGAVCSDIKYSNTYAGTIKSTPAGQPNSHFWWRVRAQDAIGNWSAFSQSFELIIDNDKPVSSFDDGLPSVTNDNTPTLTGTSVDVYDAGVASVEYSVDGPTTIGWTPVDSFIDPAFSFTTATLADGSYTISARATDNAGNLESTATHLLVVDTAAPSTTDDTDALWHNTNVTVTFSCSDGTGSGCAITYYTTDGSTPTTGSASGSSVLLSADGQYTIKYFSVDTAGNAEAVQTAANTVNIDQTPPPTPANLTQFLSAINIDPVWNWDAVAAPLSGLSTYLWAIINDDVIPTTYSNTTSLLTYTQSLTDDFWTFVLKAVDNAGNESAPAISVVTVDKTPPNDPTDVHSDSHSAGVDSSDKTIDMAWPVWGSAPGATDPTSGVAGYSWDFTTGASDVPDAVMDGDETTIAVTSSTLTSGVWYFHLRTVDNAGNWTSTVHAGPFSLIPAISGVGNSTTPVSGTEQEIHWTTDDASSSRVVFGRVSHPVLEPGPSYGYSDETATFNTAPGVTSHSIILSSLFAEDTYFYRVISIANGQTAVSDEFTFNTGSTGSDSYTGGGNDGGSGDDTSSASPASGRVAGAQTTRPGGKSIKDVVQEIIGTPITFAGIGGPFVPFGPSVEGTSEESMEQPTEDQPVDEQEEETVAPQEEGSATEDTVGSDTNWTLIILLLIAAGGLGYFFYRRSQND